MPKVTDPALLAQLNDLKLTEDQGKAQGQAALMREAESKYNAAVKQGYNPGTFRNQTASWVAGIKGIDGLAPIIRDDVSDLGVQAEEQWADAQLRAISGANSPEPEAKRNRLIYFPTGGEKLSVVGPAKASARQTAYNAALARAGASAPRVGDYTPSSGDVVKDAAYKAFMSKWGQMRGNFNGADVAFQQYWANRSARPRSGVTPPPIPQKGAPKPPAQSSGWGEMKVVD